jgi:sarcosine oxidase gamma subunit
VATSYVVLRREGGQTETPMDGSEERAVPESWVVVGEPVEATTDVAAIKAAAKDTGVDLSNGAVAVPVRSWRPRKPERKVQEVTLWR